MPTMQRHRVRNASTRSQRVAEQSLLHVLWGGNDRGAELMRGTDLNDERLELEREIEMLEDSVPEGEETPDEIQRDIDSLREQIDDIEAEMQRRERRAREREFRGMVL